MFEALSIGLIKRFQLFRDAGITDELMTGQHHRFDPVLQHACPGSATDHINEHAASDGGGRSSQPLEPLQLEYAITRRTQVIDDNVGAISELLAGGVRWFCFFTVSLGNDCNHG